MQPTRWRSSRPTSAASLSAGGDGRRPWTRPSGPRSSRSSRLRSRRTPILCVPRLCCGSVTSTRRSAPACCSTRAGPRAGSRLYRPRARARTAPAVGGRRACVGRAAGGGQQISGLAGIRNPNHLHWSGHAIAAHLVAGREADAVRLVDWLDESADTLVLRWPRFAATLGKARLAERLPGCRRRRDVLPGGAGDPRRGRAPAPAGRGPARLRRLLAAPRAAG